MAEPVDLQIYSKLLEKDYPVAELPWDTLVEIGASVLESKAIQGKVLGKLADALPTKYGEKSLAKFANDIENMGVKCAYNSLKKYRWVYRRLKDLEVPGDIPFYICDLLAQQEDPQAWVTGLKKEGWSPSQFRREMLLASGKQTKAKIIKCPKCGFEYEDSTSTS